MKNEKQTREALVMMFRMHDYMRCNPGATVNDAVVAIITRDRELFEIVMSKTELGEAIRNKLTIEVRTRLNENRLNG